MKKLSSTLQVWPCLQTTRGRGFHRQHRSRPVADVERDAQAEEGREKADVSLTETRSLCSSRETALCGRRSPVPGRCEPGHLPRRSDLIEKAKADFDEQHDGMQNPTCVQGV